MIPAAQTKMRWRTGECHCGAVRFEVLAADEVEVKDCNCSICRLTGFIHLHVENEHFRLVKGADKITTYEFNTATAKHHFCSVCGVKSFYVPRSKPDGYSVNLRCLDEGQVGIARSDLFNGQNWEQAFAVAQGKM